MISAKRAVKTTHGANQRTGHALFAGKPNLSQPVTYVPRWRTDHHPWRTRGNADIRYAAFEVQESPR